MFRLARSGDRGIAILAVPAAFGPRPTKSGWKPYLQLAPPLARVDRNLLHAVLCPGRRRPSSDLLLLERVWVGGGHAGDVGVEELVHFGGLGGVGGD